MKISRRPASRTKRILNPLIPKASHLPLTPFISCAKRAKLWISPLCAPILTASVTAWLSVKTTSLSKVHVHTNIPGEALTESQKYGTLELAKIENMRTQHDDLAAGRHVQSTDDLDQIEKELEGNGTVEDSQRHVAAPEKEIWFHLCLCRRRNRQCVPGFGLTGIISGGQTMNLPPKAFSTPSTDPGRSGLCAAITKTLSWLLSSASTCPTSRSS